MRSRRRRRRRRMYDAPGLEIDGGREWEWVIEGLRERERYRAREEGGKERKR